jgi:hypothetical protein
VGRERLGLASGDALMNARPALSNFAQVAAELRRQEIARLVLITGDAHHPDVHWPRHDRASVGAPYWLRITSPFVGAAEPAFVAALDRAQPRRLSRVYP